MTGLIIDNFAGGGGASTGIEQALGRPVDVAINHDPVAVAMHKENHPDTHHYCQSVTRADPLDVTQGRPVHLAWFSPDCTHHSKAKGGKPRRQHLRDLAWVVVLWADRVKPDVIMLENVEEFRHWGPLCADGYPVKEKRGETFDRWVKQIRRAGYKVEWRELRACDYGAPTIRKRFFLVARRDGKPITWPKPTHGPAGSGLLPYRTAAEIIDWSLPCPSIFDRPRPLAEKTLQRIARGLKRFVIDAGEPFIIPVGYGERKGQLPRVNSIKDPLGTVVASGAKHHLVTAYLTKHFGGMTGVDIRTPFPTATSRATQNTIVTSHLIKYRGTCQHGQPVADPVPTITAGGTHIGEVRAFLMKYYGSGENVCEAREPIHTIPTKERFGLVTVRGELYQITDIGMRMLTPAELFRAQGFPPETNFIPLINGKPINKTQQVRLCGNSVPPPLARALVAANIPDAAMMEAAE
ncbi:DNA cytosine methyltransferase [Sneathiella sp.]|uniref:DNA cytosine methyltransferase n=1 Tax=Sneathiella sp. TaxID=1964365 RepID=UPI002FE3C824